MRKFKVHVKVLNIRALFFVFENQIRHQTLLHTHFTNYYRNEKNIKKATKTSLY